MVNIVAALSVRMQPSYLSSFYEKEVKKFSRKEYAKFVSCMNTVPERRFCFFCNDINRKSFKIACIFNKVILDTAWFIKQ